MPGALFLSPHLDDVAFSCGGIAAMLGRAGWRTHLATAFTASVPNPTGFALACQLDKGLAADVDYMALRRDEDRAAAGVLGFSGVDWFGLPEAPHRGYHSACELFAGINPSDQILPELVRRVSEHVDRLDVDLVFAPRGRGGHADHRLMLRAVLALPGLVDRCAWYDEVPYAIRSDRVSDEALPAGSDLRTPIPLDASAVAAKLEACACYGSQLGFQFGGEAAMRAILPEFMDREGDGSAAETISGPVGVAAAVGRGVGRLAKGALLGPIRSRD